MLKVSISVLLAAAINLLLFYGILRLVTPQRSALGQLIPMQAVELVQLVPEAKEPQRVRRRQLPTPPELPQYPLEPPQTVQPAPIKSEIPASAMPMPEISVPLDSTRGSVLDEPKPPPSPPKAEIPSALKPKATAPNRPLVAAPAPTAPAKVESVSPLSTPPLGITRNPTPTYRVKPTYPRRALRFGIEGTVTVEFTITETGSVENPTIITATPPKIFDKAVLRAVLNWQFEPYVVAGKAIPRRAVQDVRFSLKEH